MKKIYISKNSIGVKAVFTLVIFLAIIFSSCKNFLEIDPPKTSLAKETVFQSDDQATSAMTGIYSTLRSSGYASGGQSSVAYYAGVSSDEQIGYHVNNIPFFENALNPQLSTVSSIYSGPYKSIYSANSILEGLALSNQLTPDVKAQLEGEALFIRAFAYFYLVNMFGSVPLHLSTDYRVTSVAPKAGISKIYEQIISDLKLAESLLVESYPTTGRVRPNKSTAQAMLARTYLYLRDWQNAEKYASIVINKTTLYSLVALDSIFLANSQETIWQLMPIASSNTNEGALLILQATPTQVSLRNSFVLNGFEPNDKRKEAWIKTYSDNTGTYYYPFKYKVRSSTTVTEYSMVLRLAEQYLIRAEARINDGKIDVGITDLNIIRLRPLASGINANIIPLLSTTLSQSDALQAVEQERKIELFSEWGHRWFDLKRTGRAISVLSPLKPQWQDYDVLYPIPQDEVSRNSNITQNDGY